jgi:kynurenine formamidase
MSSKSNLSLLEVYDYLKGKRWVDLTHSFAPGIPHWYGFPDEQRETLYYYDENVGTIGSYGIFIQRYSHVGQWGTHVDPPAHFVRGKRFLDRIDVKEMVLPLAVLDVHEKVAKNTDYAISMEDVKAWEARHGKIPAGCFVALRTDWYKHWPDAKAMENEDSSGLGHFPGWSMPVLKYLYEERKIAASGHETTDNAPNSTDMNMDMERYVLGTDHYQIELLANLDQVPEWGALIVATFPKPKNGTGFPARVFAILP